MANTAKDIFGCEFEIKGKIPKELLVKFTEVQAKLLGLRGWIETTADGVFKGYFEGESEQVRKIRELIELSENFKALIQQTIFAELKKLEEYTQENFQVKN